MLHADRVWSVSEVSSTEELATNLTEATWCCCQAFQIAGHPRYIGLNDSTSPDGAQKYAVCRLGLAKRDGGLDLYRASMSALVQDINWVTALCSYQ